AGGGGHQEVVFTQGAPHVLQQSLLHSRTEQPRPGTTISGTGIEGPSLPALWRASSPGTAAFWILFRRLPGQLQQHVSCLSFPEDLRALRNSLHGAEQDAAFLLSRVRQHCQPETAQALRVVRQNDTIGEKARADLFAILWGQAAREQGENESPTLRLKIGTRLAPDEMKSADIN
ncbi:MAG: hypothetical protein ACQETX_05965, partial [Pseudomonadota bacterium]